MFQGMPYFSLKYCFYTAAGSALLRFILTERKKNRWSIGPFLKEYIHCSQQTAFPGCFWILTNDYIIQFLGSTSSAQAILYLKTDVWIQILPNSDMCVWIMWIQIPICSLSDNSKRSEQTPVNDRLDKSSGSLNRQGLMKASLCHMSPQSVFTVQKISTKSRQFFKFVKNAGDHELFKLVLDNQ